MALTVLGACSGGAESTASTLPPTTLAPELTIQEAGDRYEQLAGLVNAKIQSLTFEADFLTYCKTAAPALQGFTEGLTTSGWPATVQPEVDRLIEAVGDEIALYEDCIAAKQMGPTFDDVLAKSLDASNQLRLALGIADQN